MDKNPIYKQWAPSVVNNLINIISFFFVAIFLSHKLSISFYGEFVSFLSLTGILYILGDFGINHLFPKIVSRDRKDKNKLATYFSFFIIIRFMACIIFAISIFLFYDKSLLLKIALITYLISRLLNPEILFKSLEENQFILYINILSKICIILMFLSYDFSFWPLEASIFFLALGNLLFCFVLFFTLILKHKVFFLFSKKYLYLFKDSFDFYYPRLIFNLYYQGSPFLLSFVLSYELVGIYALGFEFSKAGQVIIGSVSTAIYVRTSYTRDFSNLINASKYFLFIYLALLPIVIFYGDYILNAIFIFETTILFNISLLLYIFIPSVIFNSLWGYPYFSSINKEIVINKITLFSSISYFIILGILFITNNINIYSAILSLILADLVGTFLRLYNLPTNKYFLESNYEEI